MPKSLRDLLSSHLGELSEKQIELLLDYYSIVLKENRIQNLTRITSIESFYYSNIIDVLELLKSHFLGYPALDLGSGMGVPGLMSALLSENEWILAESELRKAEFLKKTAKFFNLVGRVEVIHQRAEIFLKKASVNSIVSRAVGTVEKLYSWLKPCSTWNNMILLKGPGWEKEWNQFRSGKFRNHLEMVDVVQYSVGPDSKQRKIIKLARVPRGTVLL